MKTYIVFVDFPVQNKKNGYRIRTKRFQIEAPDILSACVKAKEKQSGEVSMVWPKV